MSRDRLFLQEMIEAGERIVAIAGRLEPDQPGTDRDLLDALLWNFTVLGEACGRVSAELKDAHPTVAWSDPVRLRNRIVHGYWSVDVDILISAARDDVPGLVASLRALREAG
ncbi:MAG TPA: HepT-like ribonuclease domain-containing protein [Acidimicrobiales bacterium]|nr:HepT-like ribonuclease domain-containing protein [Acidimicrobiales bacterium]